MRFLHLTAALLLAGVLTACNQPTTDTSTTADTSAATESAAGVCRASNSREWAANHDHMPGVGAPPGGTLHVHGKVDFPSMGYTWTLTRDASDDPASGVVHLTLTATPPQVGAAVITPTDLRYDAAATAAHYTEITVACGGSTIATITDITETQ